MKISEAIETLERIKRANGDSEFWILSEAGWDEVLRVAEVQDPEDARKFTACVIATNAKEEGAGDMLAVERGYRPPSRS